MRSIPNIFFSIIALLFLLTSCGKSTADGEKQFTQKVEELAPIDGSNIDGHYQAIFTTLNPHVNGTIPGSANFLRKEDRFFAYVRLFAGGMGVWHQQYVYTGFRCPNLNDDTNSDGFVDIAEAEAVVGKILIPLDSDISTQISGKKFFPIADPSGSYQYERVTSFKRFLSDLQNEDEDVNDDIVKLSTGQGLTLSGKTFLVLGVSETVQFPETVAGKGKLKPFQTFPIACGIFKKITEAPGSEYVPDAIPGPVASVEPDQDRPANDQLPEPTRGGRSNSGTTTGTNDSDDGDGPVSDGNTDTTGGTTTGGTTTGGTTTGGTTTGGTTTGGTTTGETTTGGTTTGGTTTGGF
jgi:hypothetical protein